MYVIFDGKLIGTIAKEERVNSKIHRLSHTNLSIAIGSIEKKLNKLIDKLSDHETDSLEGSLLRAKEYIDKVDEAHKKRYVLYRAICADEQDASTIFDDKIVKGILGGMSSILEILHECGYHILDDGELEDYLAEDTPLQGVDKSRKTEIFHEARNDLLDAQNSAEVSDTVGKLADVLSDVLHTREVDLVSYMKSPASQWVHDVKLQGTYNCRPLPYRQEAPQIRCIS